MSLNELSQAINEVNQKIGFVPKLKTGNSEQQMRESLQMVANMGALHHAGLSENTMNLLRGLKERKIQRMGKG